MLTQRLAQKMRAKNIAMRIGLLFNTPPLDEFEAGEERTGAGAEVGTEVLADEKMPETEELGFMHLF